MKELNGIRRDTQRKLEAWQEQLNELAKVRQETAKQLYMNRRGATEEGWNNSDDGKKTLKDWIAVLYEENPQIQTEFQRVWEQIVQNGETALAKARQEFDDAMVEEYGTMQQKEEKLVRDWTKKLNTIPAEYLPAALQKMEEEFAALGSEKFKRQSTGRPCSAICRNSLSPSSDTTSKRFGSISRRIKLNVCYRDKRLSGGDCQNGGRNRSSQSVRRSV